MTSYMCIELQHLEDVHARIQRVLKHPSLAGHLRDDLTAAFDRLVEAEVETGDSTDTPPKESPDWRDMEGPLRLVRGQAHAIWFALGEIAGEGDPIIGAGEALAFAVDDLSAQWDAIWEAQRQRLRAV